MTNAFGGFTDLCKSLPAAMLGCWLRCMGAVSESASGHFFHQSQHNLFSSDFDCERAGRSSPTSLGNLCHVLKICT
eukprot:1141743-Pelagomonas_calceolata.AAC.6